MKITRNNHEEIYPAGPTYIRSIRAGNTLYLSGCTARNSDAEGGPVFDQLRVTFDRIVRIVEAEGGTASNIVALTTYSTEMHTMWPIEGEQVEIWEHYFKGLWPTNSYVEVSALAEPGLNVELRPLPSWTMTSDSLAERVDRAIDESNSGFQDHSEQKISEAHGDRIEKIARYMSRAAISVERVEFNPEENTVTINEKQDKMSSAKKAH